MNNSLASKNYSKALILALTLGHRGKALEIIDALLTVRGADDTIHKAQDRLVVVIKQLTEMHIAKCMLYIQQWNAIGVFMCIMSTANRLVMNPLTHMFPRRQI